MTDNHYLVPGLQALDKDLEYSILVNDHDDAEDGFVDAKERLLDVNNWSRYGNLPEFAFQLRDSHGKGLARHARRGDLIAIGAAGQGSTPWQVIDAIEYDDYPDLDMETFAIRLHACHEPAAGGMPSNSLIVWRRGKRLSATCHVRHGHEVECDMLVQELSPDQWNSLLKGLVR